MLSVIKNFPSLLFQEANGVCDHGEVFFEADAEDLRDVQRPGLSDDRHDWSLRVEEHLHLRIVFHPHSTAACHPKGCDLRMRPRTPRRFVEKRRILGIRAWPAPLNVIDPEGIQLLGHANLIKHRERNSGALRSVAQSRVVE